MKTAFTDLFGVQYPILNAGMGRIALPKMVAAVSNAGGLGMLGAGSNPPELTRQLVREIRALTDRPFGANTPLALPNGKENAKVLLDEQVPVINYSMGRGDWITERAHAYGGKTIASVTTVHLAQRAEAHGADAVIAAGHEAAGHSGDVTTMVLVARLVELLKIPVIAAGGIANGSGLLAVLALGASAASMGTRFWTTQEGPMHQNFKDLALASDIEGTVYSNRFDGIANRMMRSPAVDQMAKKIGIPLASFFQSFGIARELNIPYLKLVRDVVSDGPKATIDMMRMARMLKGNTIALTTGEVGKGMAASGMSVGLVHDLPSVSELIARIVAEAEASFSHLETTFLGRSLPTGDCVLELAG
ncbi:enoyl-[acyl-carrier protein] reductase II [Sphingomonas jinjuensis]|uniref:Enoyl-[acyl-carrier protein] reductase II n=1 Tax=Sphingomonas jinjuensis TaxID=535907 RepID=A0A840FP87_9SPHN|nr:nitronate monooxygenase [Sphingomonas jinjuensis]MBB4155095.1 enoyl-[acyl-carrier protein] reductase II [Sphingomonas jinjuensis]